MWKIYKNYVNFSPISTVQHYIVQLLNGRHKILCLPFFCAFCSGTGVSNPVEKPAKPVENSGFAAVGRHNLRLHFHYGLCILTSLVVNCGGNIHICGEAAHGFPPGDYFFRKEAAP
ncbi:MAG: hypothetical protein V8S83_03050 [Oscillospiraceae bacterium]